jgi:hypothetical protein
VAPASTARPMSAIRAARFRMLCPMSLLPLVALWNVRLSFRQAA